MPAPKVSVVCATYLRESHIKKLVASVQTAFPEGSYEIIAVSSDPPGSDKVSWLVRQDVSVIFADIRQPGEPRRRSLYAYENLGLKIASGDWVFVTNDDTELSTDFYAQFEAISDNWDVIMVNGHIGTVSLGCRTAVIGTITPYHDVARPLYLYDFTLIRRQVYQKIGYLDEGLDWFGKGFDLAMACETTPGLRICYQSLINISHAIAAEGRNPPGYVKDFQYATLKWKQWCEDHGWRFTWPW